ncbi:MAG: hypothetical protein ABIX10_12230 [Acidimicrobiales bacterium]
MSPADLADRLGPLVELRAQALLRNVLGDLDGASDLLERLAEALRLLDETARTGTANQPARAGTADEPARAGTRRKTPRARVSASKP